MNLARFLSFCCLALAVLPVQAQNVYNTYRNARYGTVVQYPSDLLPQREADNGDGRRFVSRDGAVELSVYGFHNINNRSAKGEMQRAVSDWKRDGGRLTYWKWQGNGYVLSGFTGGDIFYEKTFYKGGVFHTLIWQYPRAMRQRLDGPVTRSTRSFTATGGYEATLSRPAPKPTPKSLPRPAPRPTPQVSITVVPAPRPTLQAPTPSSRKSGY